MEDKKYVFIFSNTWWEKAEAKYSISTNISTPSAKKPTLKQIEHPFHFFS